MTIDDIFLAAVANDLPLLESRLSAKQVNLNQMLDAGVSNGYQTHLPLLFSVLNKMRANGVNHEVLEMLVRYGADPNGYVTLENDIESMKIPLLAYTLCDWDSVEMSEFLLTHGANPNAIKEIRHQSGHCSTYPMLYFAIANTNTHANEVLEVLLRHGADPNEYVNLYVLNGGFYQYLPPIYYSIVEQQNRQKSVLLFRYGASPHVTIEVGHGFAHKTNFQKYVQMVHPNLSSMLVSCFEVAQYNLVQQPASAAPAQQNAKAPVSMQTISQDMQRIQGRPNTPAPKTTSLRRCYGKFTAYAFGNFGILAISFMIFAPLIYIGDSELPFIFFCIGLPFAAICALLWMKVSRTAKARGQTNVMGQFVLDSLIMFVRFMLLCTVILIPLALFLGSNIQWEERVTTEGYKVLVRENGDGSYVDPEGNKYN